MRPPPHSPPGAKQRGAMLMLMLAILVMGISAVLIGSLSANRLKNARKEATADALARAKEALIGYAITYGDTHAGEVHGYLPCPDIDGKDISGNPAEGSAKLSCGNKNISALGRLPWKTLKLPTLRDGDGECLWYAVSGTYKNNIKTDLMNWDTNGQFQAYAADGNRLDSDYDQVIAVVFAPGVARENQNRAPDGNAPVCGGNYTASAYLDNDTAHGINNSSISAVASASSKFIQGGNDEINDRMVFITRQDLWNAMLKRSDFTNTLKLLTQRVAECLADYGRHNRDWFYNPNPANMSLPWPAPVSLSDYATNTNYNDKDDIGYQGRVPYRVNTSKSDSRNSMAGEYLMANNGLACPYDTATPTTELQRLYPWWNNWKDHLYYALSYEYRPRVANTGSCSGNCVWTHSLGHRYAAIVMFAGSAFAGKNRASTITTNTERGELHRYLERQNLNSYPNNMGNSEYEGGPADSTFNDILYCIDTDLSVANDCK